MNNSFSEQQTSETGNLGSNLLSDQNKLSLMTMLLRKKFEIPKMKQNEIADQLGHSSSTTERDKNDINMDSPYTIQPNINSKRSEKV